MSNLLCKLIGHDAKEVASSVTVCERCHSWDDYYGSGQQWERWEWGGIYGAIRERVGAHLPSLRNRCWHCDKRVWCVRWGFAEVFCNEECRDKWLPF